MASHDINCPRCSEPYRLHESLIGRKVECTVCALKFFTAHDDAGKVEVRARVVCPECGKEHSTDLRRLGGHGFCKGCRTAYRYEPLGKWKPPAPDRKERELRPQPAKPLPPPSTAGAEEAIANVDGPASELLPRPETEAPSAPRAPAVVRPVSPESGKPGAAEVRWPGMGCATHSETIVGTLRPQQVNNPHTLFLFPELPADKLANAQRKYLKLDSGELPLVLFDDTVAGSAKKGFCFTDRRLLWKGGLLGRQGSVAYADLKDVRFGKKKLIFCTDAGEQVLEMTQWNKELADDVGVTMVRLCQSIPERESCILASRGELVDIGDTRMQQYGTAVLTTQELVWFPDDPQPGMRLAVRKFSKVEAGGDCLTIESHGDDRVMVAIGRKTAPRWVDAIERIRHGAGPGDQPSPAAPGVNEPSSSFVPPPREPRPEPEAVAPKPKPQPPAKPEPPPPASPQPAALRQAGDSAVYESAEQQGLLASFPVAEMNVKAALAVWAVLGFALLGFAMVRDIFGLGLALAALVIAFGAYAAITATMLSGKRQWIGAESDDPTAQRVYRVARDIVAKAELPMPKLALEPSNEINAFTYGLGKSSAHVCVYTGFIDHVRPTDDELAAVLAHELAHVQHGDSMISTLLHFPVWAMDKIRVALSWIRSVGWGFLRGFLEFGAFGFIGLFILFAIFVFLLYLSLWIGMITLAIFICILFLNAFEREREYLADGYAVWLMGSRKPMQQVLAKLEKAGQRVIDELEKRVAKAAEGEAIDPDVAPPDKTVSPDTFIGESLKAAPAFWEDTAQREFLSDHPLTKKRIYYLEHPDERRRYCTRILQFIERQVARFWKTPAGTAAPQPARINTALVLGSVLGILEVVLPMISGHWAMDVASLLVMGLAGAGFGFVGACNCWSHRRFVRRTFLASFACATVFLIGGTILYPDVAAAFPVVFLVSLLMFGGFGLLGGRLGRKCQA